ncbi:hypothetical protein B0H63DRAFT_480684 [Podospora didyma]|uniref:GIT Spa2 homology (SHD) domain-containing protein n=1 Tax=Podospora didyma TaxID=330526 RepID=A0AAE0KED8_9PEZI|nr:hypothetical protein B0H63DRAFT_480684 [Podospora didyma]
MPGIRQNLTFQTLALLKRDDKLLRRIKLMDVGLEIKKRHDAQRVDSLGAAGFAFFPERRNDGNEKDSDSNMPSAITLSDVSNLSALTIPISPKELADSSCHYKPDTVAVTTTTEAPKIHVERSKTQDTPTVLVIRTSPTTTTFGSGSGEKTTVLPPNPRGLPDLSSSCDAVFQLPQVTESVMAEFFRRAVSVSKARFAKLFSDRMAAEAAAESGHGTDATGRRTNNTEKLRQLSLGQLKELCVDVYDELVRRNKVDSYGQTSVPVALLPVKELAEQRNQARTRLSRLNDGYFFNLIWDCYRELEQRGKGILDPLFA